MTVPADGSFQSTAERLQQDFRRQMHDHWKAYAFQGALMLIVGILALVAPFAATLASTLFFGWLLIIGGIFGIVGAFQARKHAGFWSSLALAVLVTILGFVIVYDPFAGAITLTWMLATYFIISAFLEFALARAFTGSKAGKWGLILTGILNLGLAILLILGLPGTAIWAVGVYLGISFIFSGTGLLFGALEARKDSAA
ncbi:HdeD family acid-resistance protein [Aureimonas fodinaquatilis]|uniref:HdeD family acid-resistance protein n=1 Tax=Aureimonas fodinaquatilis TaxID=2565783 RepID=A0A5B0DTI8_9HYPH|nr:HdeD family acid-resistance protein [Aureimonas fodinaquatilis]KAA0968489.1 HdeD family acid-resistance protein [Aureimonas fodinaquatilis]